MTFLSHLKHAFLGNKEKVKCASGKVAYRACDKVLLNKNLINCFITVIHLPLIKGEVGGEKEILDFWVRHALHFRDQLRSGLPQTEAARKIIVEEIIFKI